MFSAVAWLRTVVRTVYPLERKELRTWAATNPDPPVTRTVLPTPDGDIFLVLRLMYNLKVGLIEWRLKDLL